jgi:hypothetical protein
MTSIKYIPKLFVVVILCLAPSLLLAQNEVIREMNSLRGIQSMGFTVNLETNISLTEMGEIKVTSLQEMSENTLNEGGITLIPDEEIKRSDEIPFLYMHINTMDAGNGLVPFAITLYFYQPVKLSLNRDMQTTAATWESGTLGIVSYDRMGLISDAARGLLEEFISDFNDINSTSSY